LGNSRPQLPGGAKFGYLEKVVPADGEHKCVSLSCKVGKSVPNLLHSGRSLLVHGSPRTASLGISSTVAVRHSP
jgi:hypothetical protein